jgi:hypothetical protein
MLGWDQYGFDKNHVRTCYAGLVLLHPMVSVDHIVIPVRLRRRMVMHYFSCSGGTGADSTKSALRHVTPNFCLSFVGICVSPSAFQCVRG